MPLASALLTVSLALPLPQEAPPAGAPDREPPPPLAIAGEPIPWSEYVAWLVRVRGPMQAKVFAASTALERAAAEHSVRVDREEVLARIRSEAEERIARTFGGQKDAWLDELARLGSDEEGYYQGRFEEARVDLLVDRLARVLREPEEATLREAWTARYGPNGRRVELSLLHVPVVPPVPPPGATRDEVRELERAAREHVRAQVAELHARASAGEPFAELVRSYSRDSATRARDGRLEGEAEVSHWTRMVLERIAALEEGEVSEPIFARGGWNLYRADSVRVTPFEDVRDELERTLRDRRATASEERAILERYQGDGHTVVLPEIELPLAKARARMEEPVLEVDGQPVSRATLGAWLLRTEGAVMARPFAEHREVERLAAEAGLAPTPEELERRLEEDAQRLIDTFFRGDREAWIEELGKRGRTFEQWRRDTRPASRQEWLANELMGTEREITEQRLKREWEDRYGPQGRNPRVRFLMRTLREPEELPADEEEIAEYIRVESERLRQELAELRQRIVDDGLDFAFLIRRTSDDPLTRDRGGEPTGRFRLHTWPEHVQQAILALRPGELTEPLELPGPMFFVFQLVEIVDVPFESVREELRHELTTRRPALVDVRAFTRGLVADSEIRVLYTGGGRE